MVLAQRNRRTAVILAWLGVLVPGLHKFYLGQHKWGIAYLLLGFAHPISRVACAVEGVILLTESPDDFAQRWSSSGSTAEEVTVGSATLDPAQVSALGVALRELDALRQEGLISELEFEQKRRQLLERMG